MPGPFLDASGGRGFGSLGQGSTDKVTTTTFTAHNIQRTYQFWMKWSGAGGASAGRIFDKGTGVSTRELIFSSGTSCACSVCLPPLRYGGSCSY